MRLGPNEYTDRTDRMIALPDPDRMRVHDTHQRAPATGTHLHSHGASGTGPPARACHSDGTGNDTNDAHRVCCCARVIPPKQSAEAPLETDPLYAQTARAWGLGPGAWGRSAPVVPGVPVVPNHASRSSRAGPLRGDSVPTPLRRMRSAHAHEVRVTRHAAAPPGAAGERVQGDAVSRPPEALELEFRWTGAVVSHVSTGPHARCARLPELRSAGRR